MRPIVLTVGLNFLKENCRFEASALLLFLRDAPSDMSCRYSATRRSEILETHITVCNILAQERNILFQESYPKSCTAPIMGWCRRSAGDGDLIFRCPGVQIPLIVRPYSCVRNRVQIASIANTPWRFDWSPYYEYKIPYSMELDKDYNTIELEEFHVY